MVAAMLSRVVSRTRLATKQADNDIWNEKLEYSLPQNTTVHAARPTETKDTATLMEMKQRITFEDHVLKAPIRSAMKTISSRKHSYASVKEGSDGPQSFTTRRPCIESIPRVPADLQTKQSFNLDLHQKEDDYFADDEVVITDDDSDAVSVAREGSISHDSILSQTREQPASLETMPDEILDLIFSLVTLDASKDRLVDPKVDLCSCLLVSKPIHAAALRVLYRHVKLPQSKAFFKFSNSLAEEAHLGDLIQCLDFSSYSSIGFGRTRTVHTQTPYLTPSTLKTCLDRTSNLKAFLAHEHVDDELDINVLTKLFLMPSMRAIDLCSCSSKLFTAAFTNFSARISCWSTPAPFLTIERLSLHECTTLRPQVFEAILPRLARLTHLDVAHTMIDDKALLSIPSTARLTHLNIERCNQITGSAVVEFVTQHPAVRDTIQYLNLMADASRYRLLSEQDLTELLPCLPQTLRSLNIGGARVNISHVRDLRRLATHLEELGLKGANLSLSGDITRILSLTTPEVELDLEHPEWRSSLRYLDLTDVKSVSKMSLTYSPNNIVGNESVPLEVIELGTSLLEDINKSVKRQKNPEWIVRELGRRGWFVRQTSLLPSWLYTPDDGYRNWKMGTRWWGMRKIPMFEQDTGGMYGYFMFKRN